MSVPIAESDAEPVITLGDPTPSQTTTSGTREKPRSCAICAQRKVRCDKQYPCGRCRRAGIPCVLPTIDRRPQWVRNLVSPSNTDAKAFSADPSPAGVAVGRVLDRLKLLERLVKDLSSELEQARAQSTPSTSQTGSHPSDASSTNAAEAGAATPQAGRIVLDDSDRVRYVSSGFWSRIDHELDSLKEDTRGYESDEDEGAFAGDQSHSISSSSATDVNRTALERYAFLFKQSLSFSNADLSALLPMASQIPFILEVYLERVHFIMGIPHMPSLKKYLQQRRSGSTEGQSPSEEALIFSVFYAAICALDDEEVATSFNVSKDELALKYRVGLEHALANADFLNNPSDILIQALIIFLALARRNESPKFVWMMTGLVVRMAHYLGYHHDGSESKHITPFQMEMQRRIWWDLCALDMRVTEDQGTELAIPQGSYSTKIPSNLNDADIWPEMTQSPEENHGLTEITFLRLCCETARSMQEMMAVGAAETIEDHNHRLNELSQKWQREYFNLTDESQHPGYLAAAGTMRVILGRLTLLAYPPVLYSSPDADFSPEIRTKLLVAAIEVAEHNQALNSDPRCLPWRWMYQTQQHWHAVVYLLIEICRRPWSSTMERAWIALQSPWLCPSRTRIREYFSVWAPLRKLMARLRKHRANEILRLQNNPNAAAEIEREDLEHIPVPSSSTTFPTYFEPEMFRKRWRELVRPVAATNMSTLNGTGSTPLDDQHDPTHHDVRFGSSANANTVPEMAPVFDNNGASFTPMNGEAAFSIPQSWLGADVDLTDYNNLDAFLGTDTEMELVDFTNTGQDFSFDWNTWFESAKAVL